MEAKLVTIGDSPSIPSKSPSGQKLSSTSKNAEGGSDAGGETPRPPVSPQSGKESHGDLAQETDIQDTSWVSVAKEDQDAIPISPSPAIPLQDESPPGILPGESSIPQTGHPGRGLEPTVPYLCLDIWQVGRAGKIGSPHPELPSREAESSLEKARPGKELSQHQMDDPLALRQLPALKRVPRTGPLGHPVRLAPLPPPSERVSEPLPEVEAPDTPGPCSRSPVRTEDFSHPPPIEGPSVATSQQGCGRFLAWLQKTFSGPARREPQEGDDTENGGREEKEEEKQGPEEKEGEPRARHPRQWGRLFCSARTRINKVQPQNGP
ncbi:leucine-rich repeat extensin-like protein 5 [Tachyglossus aculeatus]|uniref:leucine-rich repeat extensin-like protein 5 n=1 Tax=Tachyglossus aculeatus TaxID=9261 RepID=UPI0018F29189|nr:leucine-rich repeat extensin-like protein 5 [Tachyglossus aculeatus]